MRVVSSVDIGAKVIRGPDWRWRDQDKNSIYGIIVGKGSADYWVEVKWIDKENNEILRKSYRINNQYDLFYYECIEDELSKFSETLDKLEKHLKDESRGI